jgi:hypothetical protein
MENKILSFCGDIHAGLAPPLPTNSDLGIVVGDIGYGFRSLEAIQKNLGKWKTIRGNHDSPEAAEEDITHYLGDWGNLPEYNLFFVGGAHSIDQQYRTAGLDWWYNEELATPVLEEVVQLYSEVKPDIMVTHDAPADIYMELIRAVGSNKVFWNRTCLALSQMFQVHKPKVWIFGHWHTSYRKIIYGTQFVGLNCNEICNLQINENGITLC